MKNINKAMLAIMDKVGYVQKDGRNDFHKYNYSTEAAFIAALRPAMVEEGVVFRMSDVSVIESSPGRIVFVGEYTFTHAASDEKMVVRSIGEGVDKGDKSAYKAMTGALKYALRETFLIETGDDPEADAGTDKPSSSPISRPRPKAAAPAPLNAPSGNVVEGLVDNVGKGQTKSGKEYHIIYVGGEAYETWSNTCAADANGAKANGRAVRISYTENQWAKKVKQFEVI